MILMESIFPIIIRKMEYHLLQMTPDKYVLEEWDDMVGED